MDEGNTDNSDDNGTEETEESEDTEATEKNDEDELPQTGQDWPLVLTLAMSGVTVVFCGRKMKEVKE